MTQIMDMPTKRLLDLMTLQYSFRLPFDSSFFNMSTTRTLALMIHCKLRASCLLPFDSLRIVAFQSMLQKQVSDRQAVG